jgi:hypothetical protein
LATISVRFGDQRAQRVHVLGAPHEAERDVVELLLDGEGDVGAVLVGDRRRGDLHAGEVHPLVLFTGPPCTVTHSHARALDGAHDELDQPVVDEDAVARLHVAGERLVGDRDLAAREVVRLALGARASARRPDASSRRGQRADADARALQVAEDGDVASELRGDSRTMRTRSACCSCVPCEKLMRHTLSPASSSARMASREVEAGPRVPTIFVRGVYFVATAAWASVARHGRTAPMPGCCGERAR